MTREQAFATLKRSTESSLEALAVIKATNPRPLGFFDSGAKRAGGNVAAALGDPPSGSGTETAETEAPAPSVVPLRCGERGLLNSSDDPNAEGDFHLCLLQSNHVGDCFCHCGSGFQPYRAGVQPC